MGFASRSEAQKRAGLTHYKAQRGGLRAFVSVGAPRARFFKHRLGAEKYKKLKALTKLSELC